MKDTLYPFGSWIYNPLSEFTPDEVDTWKEFGLTVTLTPMIRYGTDDIKALLPYLEKAEQTGVKLIAFVEGLTLWDCLRLGEEKYKERFTEVYDLYKKYSSLYGFFIGDEPGTEEALAATKTCVRLQREVAPELDPYINFSLNAFEHDRVFNCEEADQYMKEFVAETGIKKIGFDTYSGTINEAAVSAQINDQRNMIHAIRAAGAEPWVCLLCSSHLFYHIPSEYEQYRQIHAAAAAGCRGIIWFRMYDRDISADYHGSPIDEFGFKTEHYYRLLRCMRRFNLHFGPLLLTLEHKKTFHIGKKDGGYPKFGEGCHDVVTSIYCLDDLLVSFFEDSNGQEYMALVNLSIDINYAALTIYSDLNKGRLYKLILNGEREDLLGTGSTMDGEYLYPGQMAMYRIERGNFAQ